MVIPISRSKYLVSHSSETASGIPTTRQTNRPNHLILRVAHRLAIILGLSTGHYVILHPVEGRGAAWITHVTFLHLPPPLPCGSLRHAVDT